MTISRKWCMPSKNTFTIKPIRELISKYVGNGKNWIDPFAGFNSPAEITNDMNPNVPAKYHLHAKEFAESMRGNRFKGVLFDPPYSLRQVKECYDNIGKKLFKEDTLYFPSNVIKIIAPLIEVGGYAISFGWNSNGFGKYLGFETIEILLVRHGGKHNDTIVTVERKFIDKIIY